MSSRNVVIVGGGPAGMALAYLMARRGIAVTVLPTGVVALAAPAADAKEQPARRVDPAGDVPQETVMAYVHDAKHGVVTVVSGTTEKTYSDPALAKRLLDAAARTA